MVKAPCDEAVIRVGAAEAPCSKAVAPWVLAATILGSSITFIDGTVVNVALPVLQRDLGADIVGAQWVVEAYSVMLSALILVGGSLGDRLEESASSRRDSCSSRWLPPGAAWPKARATSLPREQCKG